MRLTGTDAWSWDAPFVHTARRIAESGDAGLIWEGHKAGRDIGYCHLEKLHNLEALPADGFQVACFPVKIRARLGRLDARRGDPRLRQSLHRNRRKHRMGDAGQAVAAAPRHCPRWRGAR